MQDLTKTKVFSSEDMRREMIRQNLKTVIDALNERGGMLFETKYSYLVSEPVCITKFETIY